MKKLLITLFLPLFLAACGGGSSDSDSSSTTTAFDGEYNISTSLSRFSPSTTGCQTGSGIMVISSGTASASLTLDGNGYTVSTDYVNVDGDGKISGNATLPYDLGTIKYNIYMNDLPSSNWVDVTNSCSGSFTINKR